MLMALPPWLGKRNGHKSQNRAEILQQGRSWPSGTGKGSSGGGGVDPRPSPNHPLTMCGARAFGFETPSAVASQPEQRVPRRPSKHLLPRCKSLLHLKASAGGGAAATPNFFGIFFDRLTTTDAGVVFHQPGRCAPPTATKLSLVLREAS